MITLLETTQHDLITPDGTLTDFTLISPTTATAVVTINQIPRCFKGFEIDKSQVFFNLKSALAQLGLDSKTDHLELSKSESSARVSITFTAYGEIAQELIAQLPIGAYVGKLFAADDRRRVRDPHYLSRMFGRADHLGDPLMALGGLHGSKDLLLDKIDGRTVAYLTLLNGRIRYDSQVKRFLPSLIKGLLANRSLRAWVGLHQTWHEGESRTVSTDDILLVKTLPLHIRTSFARVCNDLLPPGFKHTAASILQPNTTASGDIYELFGESTHEITDIPLEFYTLDPYREHVFFCDRDQLQISLEDKEALFHAFETAPPPNDARAATFVVKGEQLLNLKPKDWVVRETRMSKFPGTIHSERQAMMVERYIDQQPSTFFLEKIESGHILSQGVLFSRYFPSPVMKRMLLSTHVCRSMKAIYFKYPSHGYQEFFSAEDRAMLNDLDKFGVPVYWVDDDTKNVLRYVRKPDRDSGMFVPLDKVETFLNATVFGVYGSNLLEGDFETELKILLEGILEIQKKATHELLNPEKPLALVTGGGPGAMSVGNRVAKEVGILSCANILDFRQKGAAVVNEQKQNPYVDAKMTYRLDKLVERQAEFNLDFPIFLMGGIGTDFEQALEEVRRKVGMVGATPILLFGEEEYWKEKITSRFQCNLNSGTIKGSEWISNCFYCVQNAKEGLQVYQKFFDDKLDIGKHGPTYENGFVS